MSRLNYDQWLTELRDEEEYHQRYGLETREEAIVSAHDDELARRDRLADKTPVSHAWMAYNDRPTDRERQEAHDETRVRCLLHPRSGNVAPAPRQVPVRDAA